MKKKLLIGMTAVLLGFGTGIDARDKLVAEPATAAEIDRELRQLVSVRTKTFLVALRRCKTDEQRDALRDYIDPEYLKRHGLSEGALPMEIAPVVNIFNIQLAADTRTIVCLVDTGDDRKREVLVLRGVVRDGQLYYQPVAPPKGEGGKFHPWILRMEVE